MTGPAIDAERARAIITAIADACAAMPRGEPPAWMRDLKTVPDQPAFVSFGTDATAAAVLLLAGAAVDVEDRSDSAGGVCRQRTAHLRSGQTLFAARWPARKLRAVEEEAQ